MKDLILYSGDLAVDDRGEVGFVNEFDFAGVKRFYTVKNHRAGFIRAWHGHRQEAKYVTVLGGAALVAAVLIDDWNRPSKDLQISKYIISAKKPRVLFIPAGYANGFMSLTIDTQVVFFSTSTLKDSSTDDVRFPARYWDIWDVEER
jgi:dTDP-4-dehydrorhamnose 3,5-epimerase